MLCFGSLYQLIRVISSSRYTQVQLACRMLNCVENWDNINTLEDTVNKQNLNKWCRAKKKVSVNYTQTESVCEPVEVGVRFHSMIRTDGVNGTGVGNDQYSDGMIIRILEIMIEESKEQYRKDIAIDFPKETGDYDLFLGRVLKFALDDENEHGNNGDYDPAEFVQICIDRARTEYTLQLPQLKTLSDFELSNAGNERFPEEIFQELDKQAFQDDKRIFIISGERGIGKTRLARYYAYTHARGQKKDIKNVIFATYQDTGLQDTIAMLEVKNPDRESVTYSQKIALLRNVEKCLLIIDNYDNKDNLKKELSSESNVLSDLYGTGCKVLITSKIDTRRLVDEISQMYYEGLPTESLVTLFRSISGPENMEVDDEQLKQLIEGYLRKNTYLVKLTAALMRTNTFEEIYHAFETLHAGYLTEVVVGRENEEDSLLRLFGRLYDFAGLSEDVYKVRVMLGMALLPLEGISYKLFFEMMFEESERHYAEKAFRDLNLTYWVYHDRSGVYLHPVVREIVCRNKEWRNLTEFTSINRYFSTLYKMMGKTSYYPELPQNIKMASAAVEVMQEGFFSFSSIEIALVYARLTGASMVLSNKAWMKKYGEKALIALKESRNEQKNKLEIAKAFNTVGYALNQIYGDEKCKRDSQQALEFAQETAKEVEVSEDNEKELFILQMKIEGNFAALACSLKDYKKMLEIHLTNAALREERCLKSPEDKDYKLLLAAAYKGIGTAYFYLAGQEDSVARLTESVKYHTKVVEIYKEIYKTSYDLDIAVAENRRIGSALRLRNIDKQYGSEELQKYLEATVAAIDFLIAMGGINQIELLNAIRNFKDIIELMRESDCLSDEVCRTCDKAFSAMNGVLEKVTRADLKAEISGMLDRQEQLMRKRSK